MNLLDRITSPADLKSLSVTEMKQLAEDIRQEILHSVSLNGGHLSSSLGTVELTIALMRVFDMPPDSVIWDVGHQSYAYKLLTGRREIFQKLRHAGGCAGFQSRRESPEFDRFGGGHAGTAISAALGIEFAERSLHGEKHPRAIPVVGDGALNCGISLEGLNNVSDSGVPLVIILNDNRMSISSNVGALPSYLNRIISTGYYGSAKNAVKKILAKLPPLYNAVQNIEEKIKALLLPAGIFEELGLRYLGPVNGHSLPELIRTIELAKNSNRPVVVHVVTDKGRGYAPAEADPESYHGVGAFDPAQGIAKSGKTSYSAAFGHTMCELAATDSRLAAITAAMTSGTGLHEFAEQYPERFFDVGIAEEHAVVFAGGLAAGGLRPVTAIYSTFMQRALDPVYHDVCLQNLPVIMALDRAGLVEDGPTHHGIYDLAFLRALPNLTIFAPMDEVELRDMMYAALKLESPVVLRYSRGSSGTTPDWTRTVENIVPGRAKVLRTGDDGVIWTYGRDCFTALATAELAAERYGLSIGVVNARTLKPLDNALLLAQAAKCAVFVLEDHVLTGGLGDAVRSYVPLREAFGWPDEIIPYGSTADLRRQYGLTPEHLSEKINAALHRRT